MRIKEEESATVLAAGQDSSARTYSAQKRESVLSGACALSFRP